MEKIENAHGSTSYYYEAANRPYVFKVKSVRATKSYLVCVQHLRKASVSVVNLSVYGNGVWGTSLTHKQTYHCHLPEPEKVDNLKLAAACRKRAREEFTPFRQIYDEESLR